MAHPDFNPPADSPKLTGRRSTITGLFFTSLTPYIEPTETEVDEALAILGMRRGACVCAYCGDKKSEWDHFRAVVKDRKPTGYITEIANLVPACGKCNQSRGNKDWRVWMTGRAQHSPTARRIHDVQDRMARLEAYEAWGKPIKIDYQSLAGNDEWRKHLAHLDEVLSLLEKAEQHASRLRAVAKSFASKPRGRT